MSNHAQDQLREAAKYFSDAADALASVDYLRNLTERESFLLDNAIYINTHVDVYDA